MIHDAWDCSPGKLSLSWLWVFWVFVRLEYQNLVLLVVSVPPKTVVGGLEHEWIMTSQKQLGMK